MVSVYIRNVALFLTGKEWLKEQLINKSEGWTGQSWTGQRCWPLSH